MIAFKRGKTVAVAVLYGSQSDWVRNLLAGGGQLVRGGRTFELLGPRVVSVDDADGISHLALAAGRVSGKLLIAELGARAGPFGRGPERE